MKVVVIRCDANLKSGFGHFSRCLNIARGLVLKKPTLQIKFVGDFNEFALEQISSYNFLNTHLDPIDWTNGSRTLELSYHADLLLFDSYLATQDFLDLIKNGNYKLVVMDDFQLLSYHKVDLIVNFCINSEKKLVYDSREVALGIEYFPVKPELKEIRLKNLNKSEHNINEVLISIGGNDRYGVSHKLIPVIEERINPKTINVLGVSPLPGLSNAVMFHPMTKRIERFYQSADLVITGGGLSKYESAFCAIKNISFSQTEDVQKETLEFAFEGLTMDGGLADNFDSLAFSKLIEHLPKNIMEPSIFRQNARDKFNTESLEKLALKILN